MTDQIDQSVLDEGMQPELSEDFFDLLGQRVQIKPLKLKYQKQFAKSFAPILDSIALAMAEREREAVAVEEGKTVFMQKSISNFSVSDWMGIGAEILNQVEFLPQLVKIICHNDGFMVKDEELDESDIQQEDMQKIIISYCKKRGEVEQRIVDFFERVLPLAKNELLGKLTALEAKIMAKMAPAATTNTASSKRSAKTTATN